jgi:hypothetical protein
MLEALNAPRATSARTLLAEPLLRKRDVALELKRSGELHAPLPTEPKAT